MSPPATDDLNGDSHHDHSEREPGGHESLHRYGFERFRGYLRVLAKTQLASRLNAKVDSSDLAQQTLIEAYTAPERPRTDDTTVVAAWLRRILANNIANTYRDLQREKRDVRRERRLHVELDESSVLVERFLVAPGRSPSNEAVKLERMTKLAEALDALPARQRQAVVLRHFQEMPLVEIARELQSSTGAAAALIHRGLRSLRRTLSGDEA